MIRPGAFARTLSEQRQADPTVLAAQPRPSHRLGRAYLRRRQGPAGDRQHRQPRWRRGRSAEAGQGQRPKLRLPRARLCPRFREGRVLSDIQLLEVSLVTHPMQHAARVHLTDEAIGQAGERKFNQRHYVENGQFARAGEGVDYGGGASSSETARLYDQRNRQRSMFIANATAKARELGKAGRGKEASAMRGRARLAENDVRLRYPGERYDALLLLSGKPMSSF